jgi:protein-disulfide isomerase
MSDRKILLLAMLAVVVVVAGGAFGFLAWRSNRTPQVSVTPAVAAPAPVPVEDGKPILLGSAARVTVTLYEDFHCPHCADFEEEFGPTLTAAQQRGQVQIALYPMSFIDSGSVSAANAMACAAEAGFGNAYYLGLFANHTLPWTRDQLVDLAGKVGGTATPAFTSCVTNQSHLSWVESINTAAAEKGVDSTPTMFLGGAAVDLGSLTPATLESKIADAAKK